MTPEDKETAMSEAVEAAARAFYDEEADGWRFDQLDRALQERYKRRMHAALRALLEPRITICETCWGRVNDVAPGAACKAGCDQGQIVRPSIAVLRGDMQQVVEHYGAGVVQPMLVDGKPVYCFASEEGTGNG